MRKFLIKLNGVQYEVECEEITDSSVEVVSQTQVSSQTAEAAKPAAPVAEKKETPVKVAATGAVGDVKVNSPMPGSIVKVLVNPGDQVKKGDVLLILEAMKMENEILASKDGTVATVNVSKGSSVNAGDLLVSLNS